MDISYGGLYLMSGALRATSPLVGRMICPSKVDLASCSSNHAETDGIEGDDNVTWNLKVQSQAVLDEMDFPKMMQKPIISCMPALQYSGFPVGSTGRDGIPYRPKMQPAAFPQKEEAVPQNRRIPG